MAIETTSLPKEELELFKQLKDLKVIFDVGARTNTDYLEIWLDSQHHLFEPNPLSCDELKRKVGDKSNVHINAFGLGDRKEERGYRDGLQSFVNSWQLSDTDTYDQKLLLMTLSEYAKEKNIEQIDFLKIDTEGFELKVLLGAIHYLDKIRFIQYEHWGTHNNKCIKGLLQDDFWTEEVGYRNVFCVNKKLVSEEERGRLRTYIEENKLAELV